jgi:hypothetical protein
MVAVVADQEVVQLEQAIQCKKKLNNSIVIDKKLLQ